MYHAPLFSAPPLHGILFLFILRFSGGMASDVTISAGGVCSVRLWDFMPEPYHDSSGRQRQLAG